MFDSAIVLALLVVAAAAVVLDLGACAFLISRLRSSESAAWVWLVALLLVGAAPIVGAVWTLRRANGATASERWTSVALTAISIAFIVAIAFFVLLLGLSGL